MDKAIEQIFVDISGRKIENMTLPSNSVPAGAAVFLKDKSGNTNYDLTGATYELYESKYNAQGQASCTG